MSHVLVLAEQTGGTLRNATLNAVTFGKEVASRSGGELYILVLGSGIGGAVDAAKRLGAKKVLVADDPALEHYLASPYAQVVAATAKAVGAGAVVTTATAMGKDLLPRVAARLDVPMASDVIGILDDWHQYQRPMWAGNIIADVALEGDLICVSCRSVAFVPAEPGDATAEVENVPVAIDDVANKSRFVKFEGTPGDRPELTEADTVVAGGRGMKSEENFKQYIEALADAFGAAVGASRAAVDSGYAPNDYQIGQTGKVVAPDLYIGIAISGAIQHVAGMSSSKVIVAINKDPDAPIFGIADYGLVADAFQAVPELAEKIKAYMASK